MSEITPQPTPEHRHGLLESLTWGAIFIWAGLVYLLSNLGLLQRLLPLQRAGLHLDVWGLILLGAGLILLAGGLLRTFRPELGRADRGSFILAAVLIGVGLSQFFSWNVLWPLVLIAVGVGLLIRGRV